MSTYSVVLRKSLAMFPTQTDMYQELKEKVTNYPISPESNSDSYNSSYRLPS